jgi:hypothetical protein
MKRTHWLILAAGTTAALVVSCAPVEFPAPEEKAPERSSLAPAQVEDPPPPNPAPGTDGPRQRPQPRNDTIRPRIDAAIRQVRQRDLLTTNGFWTVFHGILGLGPAAELVDPNTRQRFNALDYIAGGGEVRGMRFVPTPFGLEVETRPGTFVSQGHQDQFVAEMVEWGVSPDRKFLVAGKEHTFREFINHSKMRTSVRAGQELEWSMLIIGQHEGTDAVWVNAAGETVRFEQLLRHELDAPLDDAACGGTHRLFGLSWVYHLHLQRGGKTEGIWKEVADRLADCKRKAREMQNGDGSFSTNWFRGRGYNTDMQARLSTTGHIFEWLALACTDEELDEPWMRNAANCLALMFFDVQRVPMEGGTLYHATHGLLIYYARVYGPESLGPNAPHVALPPREKK